MIVYRMIEGKKRKRVSVECCVHDGSHSVKGHLQGGPLWRKYRVGKLGKRHGLTTLQLKALDQPTILIFYIRLQMSQ